MLSSVLEASVSSRPQPPESSISVCRAEFYGEGPSNLLAELGVDGPRHAELEASNVRIVLGSNWSSEQERTLTAEKCKIECRNHEDTTYCGSGLLSPAAELSPFCSMDNQTRDGMEAPHFTEKAAILCLSKETSESLLQENMKSEAQEVTAEEVMETEILVQLTQPVLSSEHAAWESSEQVAQESVAQATLESVWPEKESLKMMESQYALGQKSQKALEQKDHGILEPESLEQDTMVMNQKSLQWETKEILEEMMELGAPEELKQTVLAQEASEMQEVLEREAFESLEQTEMAQEACEVLDCETLEAAKQMPAFVPKEMEYIAETLGTMIPDCNTEGENHENVNLLLKSVPMPCKKAPVCMAAFGVNSSSSVVHWQQMNDIFTTESDDECPVEDQPLSSSGLSEKYDVPLRKTLTPLNKEPSPDTTHTTTECTSAEVCHVSSVLDVYNTSNQVDHESSLNLESNVHSLALDHCLPDHQNVVESLANSPLSTCAISFNPTTKERISDSKCDFEVAVPPSPGEHVLNHAEPSTGTDHTAVCKIVQELALQECTMEEQLLPEEVKAGCFSRNDGNLQEEVINAISNCGAECTGDDYGPPDVCSGSLVQHVNQDSPLSDSQILCRSAESSEVSSKELNRKVCRKTHNAVICGLVWDPVPQKSVHVPAEATLSSEKERIHLEGVCRGSCTCCAAHILSDAHWQKGRVKESLCRCPTKRMDTSVMDMHKEKPLSCKGMYSDMEKQCVCPSAHAPNRPHCSIGSCVNLGCTESILQPVSLSTSEAGNHMEVHQKDDSKNWEKIQTPVLDHEHLQADKGADARDSVYHSAKDLNNLNSVTIEAPTSSHRDCLDNSFLISQMSDRERYAERDTMHDGQRTEDIKDADFLKDTANGQNISTAHTEFMDTCDTGAAQSESVNNACRTYSPLASSTALNICALHNTEVEANVTLKDQHARNKIECSKEDALNTMCRTLPHTTSVLHLDTNCVVEAKSAFENDSSCDCENGIAKKMHSHVSGSHPSSLHSEYPISPSAVPLQNDSEEHNKSNLNLSIVSGLSASPAGLESGILNGGNQVEFPLALGSSSLDAMESSDLKFSVSQHCSEQAPNLSSSPSHILSSKVCLEYGLKPASGSSCSGAISLLACLEHKTPTTPNEIGLPKLLKQLTVTRRVLPERECTTSFRQNKQGINPSDSAELPDPIGSFSDLPADREQCGNVGTEYRNALIGSCHGAPGCGVGKNIESPGVCGRQHCVMTTSKSLLKSDKVDLLCASQKEVMILLQSDEDLRSASAAPLEDHVLHVSPCIAEFKMSCEQFSTDNASLIGTFQFDCSKSVPPEAYLTTNAAVEPTLQPSTGFGFKAEPEHCDIVSDTKDSISMLKGSLLPDLCQGAPSKLEACNILSPPSAKRQSLECNASMGDVECLGTAAAELCLHSLDVKAMQCIEMKHCPTQDVCLYRLKSFSDIEGDAEMTQCNPCLASLPTQKTCNLQAEYPLGIVCHPLPDEICAKAAQVVSVSKADTGQVISKRKRVSKGMSKRVSESMPLSDQGGNLKPGLCSGLEIKHLMQETSYTAEPPAESSRTVALSTRSLKIGSICGHESLCRTEVKDWSTYRALGSKSMQQEIKRPKISTRRSGALSSHPEAPLLSGNSNRCLLSCAKVPPPCALSDSTHTGAPMHNLFGALESDCKPIKMFGLKKQPDRKCKMIPPPEPLRTVRKMKPRKSLSCLKMSPEPSPQSEPTPVHFVNRTVNVRGTESRAEQLPALMPKQRQGNCQLLNCLKLRKSTKEAVLLDRLSLMASKLLRPAQTCLNVKPSGLSSSKSVMLPDRFTLLRSNRLLEIFSCIKMRMDSHGSNSWSSVFSKEGPAPFSNQPMALYPGGPAKIHCTTLCNSGPAVSFGAPSFPMSFHLKLDSRQLLEFARPSVQHFTPGRWDSDSLSSQPSEWTLSFFMSQSPSATEASNIFREDFSFGGELKPRPLCLRSIEATDTTHERGRSSMSRSHTGCSIHGLHTVLALSSPGCYRVWTRRRHLGSRIPTVQRLFMAQFTQGLKGMKSQASITDEPFSSLPYSLGRVLSTWSQHGVTTSPPVFPDVHSNAWQPPVNIKISHGQFPHMPLSTVNTTEILGSRYSHHEASSFAFTPIPGFISTLASSPLEHFTSQLQVHPFDDVSPGSCVRIQNIEATSKVEEEKKPQRVSQIRIRKTIPKQDSNLTPMGLPRPKRIKKKEFSLEEIYTNKNYKSPPAARCLETIFEEPKEKNGSLVAVSQQKRKRVLEFQDFTIPRKRKAKGKVKLMGNYMRGRRATLDGSELDALLIQKLMDLEIFLAEEEAREEICGH
ncbi:protein PRR14L isoform X4 [Ambystoma mexicanum]|uniref:protein PRR14L isoform X4 n=1 Tax=Ambystoma mexicanum TaxID=8296 RepID=UPI0037E85AAB